MPIENSPVYLTGFWLAVRGRVSRRLMVSLPLQWHGKKPSRRGAGCRGDPGRAQRVFLPIGQHHAQLKPNGAFRNSVGTGNGWAVRGRVEDAFEAGPWGQKYPAIVQSWRRAWAEVIPFYAFPDDVRRIVAVAEAAAEEEVFPDVAEWPLHLDLSGIST